MPFTHLASIACGWLVLGAAALFACGGSVNGSAPAPESGPASSGKEPEPSDGASVPTVPPTACTTEGIIAEFDAPIVDIAVDDNDVWAVLARDRTWSVFRVPKCGGTAALAGNAPQHGELRDPVPLRVAIAPRGGAVVQWWDRSPIVALKGFGAAANVDQIALGASDFVPLALAIGADTAFTSRGSSLDAVHLNDGQLTKMPLQLVSPGESQHDHVHDLWLDDGTLYATTNTRVLAVDIATQSALGSPIVLPSQGPRFVRSMRDRVFLLDTDVVRLAKDLSSWEVVPTGVPGVVLDAAIDARGLFYAKREDDGHEVISRLRLDGDHPEPVSARAGIDTQLAVDANALFVARDSHVERIALTAL